MSYVRFRLFEIHYCYEHLMRDLHQLHLGDPFSESLTKLKNCIENLEITYIYLISEYSNNYYTTLTDKDYITFKNKYDSIIQLLDDTKSVSYELILVVHENLKSANLYHLSYPVSYYYV